MRRTLALLLLAPALARPETRAARLTVTARVVRSVAVSVAGGDAPYLSVRTPGGEVWSAPLGAAASAGAIRLERSAAGPETVVVTVHADAPRPAPGR